MAPERASVSRGDISVRVAKEIEALLTKLESCRSAGLLLPAELVEQAAVLIRFHAESQARAAHSWLDLEHARRIAKLLKHQRFLGTNPFRRPKPRLSPTPSELLAQQASAEPSPITLFDLVKEFEGLLERAKKYSSAADQLQDPL